MIIKIINQSINVNVLEYYDLSGRLIATVKVDKLNKEITVDKNASVKKCDGQKVADCIDRIYTKSGWASVFMFAATIIVPEIGLAVAGGCSAGVCL